MVQAFVAFPPAMLAPKAITLPPSQPLLSTFISGTLFGYALSYSGVSSPAVMHDQFSLANSHMVRVFLSASAMSALILHVLPPLLSLPAPLPRAPSALAVFAQVRYSANIAGGLILGAGMALALACPGIMFSQVIGSVAGIEGGKPYLTLVGGLVGGMTWVVWGSMLRVSAGKEMDIEKKGEKELERGVGIKSERKMEAAPKLDDYFGLSRGQMLVVYFAVWIVVLCGSLLFDSRSSNRSAYVGWFGLLRALSGGAGIAAAQALTLALTGRTLGCSAIFDEAGRWVVRMLKIISGREDQNERKPGFRHVAFALGIFLGASLMLATDRTADAGKVYEASTGTATGPRAVGITRAIVGGALLTFGGRLAGGCTSGHGISGVSVMSLASIVSVAAMFVGAFSVASMLR